MVNRSMDKPGILFIVPSLCRAGAETQVVGLANGLESGRFKKYLLSYLENLDQYARIDQEEVDFYHVPRKGRFDLNLIKTVARIIDRNSIDLIHCTMQHALLIGWLARLFSRRKPRLLAAIHTTTNESRIGELSDRWLYCRLLRSCDRIVFVCRTQRKFWTERYPFLEKNSTVVYNGVDTEHFDPDRFVEQGLRLRVDLGIPEESPIICCIAGFRPEKAHDMLIEAFAKLDSSCFLLLAGDGEKRNIIEHMVRSKNLQDRIRFLGIMSDVRPVLAASDVSVLSSSSVETFSMAMLESMSMAVPVVATDVGGLNEAITPCETGMLVQVGNAGALAQAIGKVLRDRERIELMRKKSRQAVLEKFSQKTMVRNTEQVIDGLPSLIIPDHHRD